MESKNRILHRRGCIHHYSYQLDAVSYSFTHVRTIKRLFMGLFTMYPFIRPAKWTDILFYAFHKDIGNSLLTVTGMTAYRTQLADACKFQIKQRITVCDHGKHPSSKTLLLNNEKGPTQ
jgi:hypothetical protein